MINVMCIFIFVNWDTLVPWAYQLCCLPSINNTIQYNTSKHLVSSLNSCQAVHKRHRAASHWQNGRGWPRSEFEVAIESPYTAYFRIDFRCLEVDNIVALWLYERFNFNESCSTIHPFFAPKIADAIICYACRC